MNPCKVCGHELVYHDATACTFSTSCGCQGWRPYVAKSVGLGFLLFILILALLLILAVVMRVILSIPQ